MKLFQAVSIIGSFAVAALLGAATPYSTLNVHIPFAFVAAGQEFAAGDYQVQHSDNGVVLIQGNGKAAATISIPGNLAKPGAPSGLQFTSDGRREHLVGVQVEGEATRNLPYKTEESRKVSLSSR
jgi:hypothetical protein